MGTRHLKRDHHHNSGCEADVHQKGWYSISNNESAVIDIRHKTLKTRLSLQQWLKRGLYKVRQWIETPMIVCSIRWCYINRAWIQSAGLMFIRRADIQSATINQRSDHDWYLFFLRFNQQWLNWSCVFHYNHFCVCFVPHPSILVLFSIISQHHDEDNSA